MSGLRGRCFYAFTPKNKRQIFFRLVRKPNTTNMKTLFFLTLLISFSTFSQSITIATWNIEHLGSGGRGFPEFSTRDFDKRNQDDFDKIGELIQNELSLEIVCAQEVSSSDKEAGISYSDELKKLTKAMGPDWKYYLAIFSEENTHEDEMQNAFIYNSAKVELKNVFELPVPDTYIGEKKAFDRKPLVGYFESVANSDGFILVNVHLASGQDNDENHMASMIIIEQNIRHNMQKHGINKKEKDIIILGDFNDNPWNKKRNGECCATSDLMYQYMESKGYSNLVNESFKIYQNE